MYRLLPCCRFVLLWLVLNAVSITCFTGHECGPSSYTLDNGMNITLESPGYPELYPDNVRCETNITGPTGSALRFTFLVFDLQRRVNIFSKCNDLLKLQELVDGVLYITSQVLRCGRPEVPLTVISRTNQVSVVFLSDDVLGYHGYQIVVDAVSPRPLPISRFLSHYDVTPKIVQTIDDWIPAADDNQNGLFDVTPTPPTSTRRPSTGRYVGLLADLKRLPVSVSYDTVTYLTSISYPEDYPSDTSYITRISGPAGSVLEFKFVDFSVEASPESGGYASCRYDFVIIEETDDSRYRPLSDKKSRYCGTEGPRQLVSSGNEARLTFHSDQSNEDRGFNISVRAIRGPNHNFNLSAEGSITFTSPNFPLPYPRDTNLTFEFTTPAGYHFNFQPVSFGLEYDSVCQYDSLTFKEFDPATSAYTRPLGRPYCGYNMPSLQSSTNKVAAYFYTDSYLHHSGFNITVSAIRNTPTAITIPGNGTMYITSPNYPDTYPTFSNLTYDIKAPEGYVVVLETVAFNLEGPFSECPHDHVRFFERVNKRVTLLGSAYYCSLDGPDDLASKTNHVKMVFQSDFSINHSGFNISAHAIKPEPVTMQSTSSSAPSIVKLNAISLLGLVTFCYAVYENLH